GSYTKVVIIDATMVTPAVNALQAYSAVLVWSGASFKDSVVLGDNLATYHDGGGRVVIASTANVGGQLKGRFGTPANGYVLLQPGAQEQPQDSLGAIAEPNSPLMKGVVAFGANEAIRCS